MGTMGTGIVKAWNTKHSKHIHVQLEWHQRGPLGPQQLNPNSPNPGHYYY